jgi:hypothetical protein
MVPPLSFGSGSSTISRPVRYREILVALALDFVAAEVEKYVEEHQDTEIVCSAGTRSWVVCAKTPR